MGRGNDNAKYNQTTNNSSLGGAPCSFVQNALRKEANNNSNTIISVVAIIISMIALVVSILEYSVHETEYISTIKPKISVGSVIFKMVHLSDNTEKAVPLLRAMDVNVIAKNNMDRLYIIDPDFQVSEIDTQDVSGGIKKYFNEENDGWEPAHYLDTNNGIYYFYCFLVFKGLDGSFEVHVMFFKSDPSDEMIAGVPIQIDILPDVKMIEFEKGHLNDSKYTMEREIAAKYKEIVDYLDKLP